MSAFLNLRIASRPLILCVIAVLFTVPAFSNIEDAADDSGLPDEMIDAINEESPDVELQQIEKIKQDKKTIIRTVRRSDSLQGILTSNGFSVSEVYNLLALPSWPKHYVLTPGARYLVSVPTQSKLLRSPDQEVPIVVKTEEDEDPVIRVLPKGQDAGKRGAKEFVELVFFIPRSSEVLKLFKAEGETELSISDLNFETRVKQVSGTVEGSIYSSLRRVVPESWVLIRFLDAYSLDYKLEKQVRRGAKFTVTFEEKLLNGQYVAPGEVLHTSIEVDGLPQKRTLLRETEGGGAFVATDADHDLRPFYSPIEYLHISSPFNMRRFHPIRRRRIPHRGSDFALNHGSNVMAAQGGSVTRMGRNKAAGIFVVLSHPNGYNTEYVHMSSVKNDIRVGSRVTAGQILGSVGCTGYCTRPHLHFGISKDGKHFDPVKLLKPYTALHERKVKDFSRCIATETEQACAQKVNN